MGRPRIHNVQPGERYGSLVIQREVPLEYEDGRTERGVLVKCEACGTERAIDLKKVVYGDIRSCGCRGHLTPEERQLRRKIRAMAEQSGYTVGSITLRRREP